MTYAASGLIQATDYNTLAFTNPSVGGHLGTGTGNHGLGQSTSAISTLATGATVTALQWTGLVSAINSVLNHQGQSVIAPSPSIAAGSTVTYYNVISTGTATAYNNAGTTGVALTDGAANTTSYASAWGTSGSRSLVFTQSVTFASGDAARYFFNAGGKIKLSLAQSGGGTTRDLDWRALATACGSVQFGYNATTKVGGSGSTSVLLSTAGTGGYWAGTGSYVVHFRQYDSSVGYTTDYVQIEYYWSGTAANGGSPVLNIKTTWVNGHVQAFQDTVGGTCSTSLVVSSPSTTYITNTWGTPTFSGSAAPV